MAVSHSTAVSSQPRLGDARVTYRPVVRTLHQYTCNGNPASLRVPTCQAISAPGKNTKPKLCYVGTNYSLEGINPAKALWTSNLEGCIRAPNLSKSDEHFLKLGVEFVEGKDGIVLSELNELFEKVGFPRRDIDRLRVALDNTYRLIWIRCNKQSRLARMGQLLGFARATSDGVLSATIWDVAVNPAWQRVGLGRAMIERLTKNLVDDGIPTVTLYAEPNVVGLYEKLGFVKDPEGIRGMAFQRQKPLKAPMLTRT